MIHPPQILASALGATIRQAPASARRVVRDVCRLVTQRSAILIAMAIDGLLTHTGWVAANSSSSSSSSSTAEPPAGAEAGKKGTAGYTVVAFDGSVYEKFALYRYLLRQALDAQMGPQLSKQVKFELCHDGSCLGAAVLAAAAVK
jgi:hexokinase